MILDLDQFKKCLTTATCFSLVLPHHLKSPSQIITVTIMAVVDLGGVGQLDHILTDRRTVPACNAPGGATGCQIRMIHHSIYFVLIC